MIVKCSDCKGYCTLRGFHIHVIRRHPGRVSPIEPLNLTPEDKLHFDKFHCQICGYLERRNKDGVKNHILLKHDIKFKYTL